MDIGIAHLLEASIKLECNMEVTARGMLLYHHFVRASTYYPYDKDVVAAGSLFLAGRLNEKPVDMNALICVFYSIVNQTTETITFENPAYKGLRRSIVYMESLMLRITEFDLNHRLAHKYLVPFFAMLFERNKDIADFSEELGSSCVRFINDFFTLPICLEYLPEVTAVACIDLSLYIHGLINDLHMPAPWYIGFVPDITPDEVKKLKKIIMKLYEKLAAEAPAQQIVPSYLLSESHIKPSSVSSEEQTILT